MGGNFPGGEHHDCRATRGAHPVESRALVRPKHSIERAENGLDRRWHMGFIELGRVPSTRIELKTTDGQRDREISGVKMSRNLLGKSHRGDPGRDPVGHEGEMKPVWGEGAPDVGPIRSRRVELTGGLSEILVFAEVIRRLLMRQSVASDAAASVFRGCVREPIRSLEDNAEPGSFLLF